MRGVNACWDLLKLLADPKALEAFRLANKVMAQAARQRRAFTSGTKPEDGKPPAWRPFQLAFILMNLPAMSDPTHRDRGGVDLLFFPTGGGKTEAYLGLAAFTLVLHRLKHPDIQSAGLSVLMRYTLRLLTLDQLGRASTLICALELERQANVEKLGTWPFEIGPAVWLFLDSTLQLWLRSRRFSTRLYARELTSRDRHDPSTVDESIQPR